MEPFDPENLEPQGEIPGNLPGSAIQPKGKTAVGNAAGNAADKLKEQATEVASKAAGKGVRAALTASGLGALGGIADKATEWLTKKILNKGWWKALLLANWPTLATITIMFGLILIILVPAFAGMSKARRGGYGKTPLAGTAYASAEDRTLINQLALLAKGSSIDPLSLNNLAQQIITKINNGELTFTKKNEALTALNQIVSLTGGGVTLLPANTQKQIFDLIKQVLEDYNNNPVGLEGVFANPAGAPIISLNNTLHGRSVMHPGHIEGHNVFHGWSNPGLGDAVDIKLGAGKPAKAMFNGTVTTNGSSGKYLCAILTSDSSYANKIEAWYCHVQKVDTGPATAGKVIAETMTTGTIRHIHFEVWVDGKSIHTTPADLAQGAPYGKYLWQHIKDAFNFSL